MLKGCFVVLTGLFPGTFAGRFAGETDASGLTVPIDVAPRVVNLRFEAKRMTVHAEIPFGTVDCTGLKLSVDDDFLAISATKLDLRGELVVKATWHLHELGDDEMAELRERGSARVTLDGVTTDGVPFSGTSTVRVILSGE